MAASILKFTLDEGLGLIQSVTPLAGEPAKYEDYIKFRKSVVGDERAKTEAMDMMKEMDEVNK